MRLLGVGYEHGNWSVGRDFERIRAYNPLARVPTLVLDDGEVLSDSACILDYLDQQAGPPQALLPVDGDARRTALQFMAYALGAAEFARDVIYERLMRPAEKQHEPWSARRRLQLLGALDRLEVMAGNRRDAEWLVDERMTQADITVACCFSFLTDALPMDQAAPHLQLRARATRMEQLPDFQATRVPFFPPATPAR
jgi:glutathione S-transferase